MCESRPRPCTDAETQQHSYLIYSVVNAKSYMDLEGKLDQSMKCSCY